MKKISVIEVTKEDIRKFCRLEISYEEFKKGEPDGDLHCMDPYFIRLDEIHTALKTYKKKGIYNQT